MQNLRKPILSLLVTILFMVCALASFGPDASTNTTTEISNCEEEDPTEVKLNVLITLHNKETSNPVDGDGRLFIVHQKVNPDDECKFSVIESLIINFTTGFDGEFNYNGGTTWIHDNTEDLYRIEVEIFDDPFFTGYRKVQVGKYSVDDFTFYMQAKFLP